MNRIFTIATLFLFSTLSAFSQNNSLEQLSIAYDSTSNFLDKNAEAYIGQELYLKGLEKSSQSYGYSGFILKYKKDNDLLNDEKNIYKPNNNYNSRYEDLAGKYFHVLEVIKPDNAKKNSKENGSDFYLKLQELSSGDIMYYKYNVNSEYTFPFIVRGFFEKQKQLQAGKEYVVADDILKISRNLITGKSLIFNTGEVWKCTDLTIDNVNNEVGLILQNMRGTKTIIPYSMLINSGGIKKVYTASEAKALTKKYNANNFRRILQNKIRVGMTKDMVRLAWGDPSEVQNTGKTEQWIYPAGVLVFNGEKIITTK